MAYHLNPMGVMVQLEPEKARRRIARLLRVHEGNITHVAEALGVTRQTLHNWLKKLSAVDSRA